uniref:Thyroid hormone responsive n=2 Tax=Latimeria chalumnae TaxID=7897 RepID=H3A6B6_LATCH
MQSAEFQRHRSCLAAALGKYTSAVNNMEEMVMLPSLLRDEQAMDEPSDTSAQYSAGDLYDYYTMLKSIRNVVECGPVIPENYKAIIGASKKTLEKEDPDLEVLFHIHLTGLSDVLSSLTKKANMLTRRYKEILGLAN